MLLHATCYLDDEKHWARPPQVEMIVEQDLAHDLVAPCGSFAPPTHEHITAKPMSGITVQAYPNDQPGPYIHPSFTQRSCMILLTKEQAGVRYVQYSQQWSRSKSISGLDIPMPGRSRSVML